MVSARLALKTRTPTPGASPKRPSQIGRERSKLRNPAGFTVPELATTPSSGLTVNKLNPSRPDTRSPSLSLPCQPTSAALVHSVAEIEVHHVTQVEGCRRGTRTGDGEQVRIQV